MLWVGLGGNPGFIQGDQKINIPFGGLCVAREQTLPIDEILI